VDLCTGAVLGNEAVPDGRMGKRVEEIRLRGCRRVCQNGVGERQVDGRNQGVFLYIDGGSTAERRQ